MRKMKDIGLFLGILIAIVCSISLTYAATTSLAVTMEEGSGNGYYITNITEGVYSDILGYTPNWNSGDIYDATKEGLQKGHTVFMANGRPIYCIEPGILISLESIEYDTNYQYDAAKHARIHSDEMAWILYYGYLSPALDHTDRAYYDATQQLVWQTVYPGLDIVWYTDPNNMTSSDTDNVAGKVQEIKDLVANATNMVSISAPSNVTVGETKTFSGDFSNYTVKLSSTTDATIVSQSSSGLSIKFNTTNPVTITLTKKFTGSTNVANVVYSSGTNQDLIASGLKVPTVSKSITVTAHGGNFEIVKTSSKTSGFLGDSTLEGAVYTVKYSGNEKYSSFELTTDENGIATTKGTKHDGVLPVGTYTIKEKTPSRGYSLDPNTYTVTINTTNYSNVQKVNVIEPLIEAKIQIVKVEASANTGILVPEANKVFKLYPKFGDNTDTAIATLTTDSDGYALTSNIPYGVYVLKQTEAGTSEPIQPIEIVIDEDTNGKTLKYVLANAPYSAKVKVVKRDSSNDEIIAKAGTKFKIKWLKDESGKEINEYITQTITLATGKKKKLEYFETDEDGTFITPESLKPGTYQLEEVNKIDGYELNEEPIVFEIFPSAEGFEIDEEYGLLLTLDFYNTPEEKEPNPPTSDSIIYVVAGVLILTSLGIASYRKIRS